MNEDKTFGIIVGTVAALVLFAFYLTIVALAEGRAAVTEQLGEDLPYFVFLFPGFGTQVGLFAYVRRRAARLKRAGAVTGTASGVSATAIVACCAHFIPTLLPIVGVSAVATLLAAWKAPLLISAIVLNFAGVGYMVWNLKRHGAILQPGVKPS